MLFKCKTKKCWSDHLQFFGSFKSDQKVSLDIINSLHNDSYKEKKVAIPNHFNSIALSEWSPNLW